MKRFTETTVWDKPWYRMGRPAIKELWRYLCDHCDAAGVWSPDWELVSFKVGEPLTEADLKELNGNARMRDGKVFLPGYLGFQYPNLSRLCKPHQPAFEAIERHGLKAEEFDLKGNQSLSGKGGKVADVGEDDGAAQKTNAARCSKTSGANPASNGQAVEGFAEFWAAYPRKLDESGAKEAFVAAGGKEKLPGILAALKWHVRSDGWKKDGGKWIPGPGKWLRGMKELQGRAKYYWVSDQEWAELEAYCRDMGGAPASYLPDKPPTHDEMGNEL